MKVKFGQKYYTGTDSYIELIGTCYYYLAFNKVNNKFYRLGGFETVDVDDFFDDIKSFEGRIFDIDDSSDSEIDFYCLFEYSQLSKKKKAKKGFECFQSCSEEISEYLVSP